MQNIAILGFGVVGGGITEVIKQNSKAIENLLGDEVFVKYILDLRDFPDSPYNDRIVHDIDIIVNDSDIKVVCEAMGGVNPAFDFSVKMLKAGKSVVTSNKELVAKKGIELASLAGEMGVSYCFEAAVGGGIPEIRGMRASLAADTVSSVDGILNGTTNYILTRMEQEGISFEEALSEAQRLGYAEKDPTADVDGYDAQRKIIILTAVATDKLCDEKDVYRESMRNITPLDMSAARRFGGTVKLLGCASITENSAYIYVCPFIVKNSCPLSHVDGVYNGILLDSPVTGDIMFYGRGAGRMPTAGAIVSDVVSVLSGLSACEKPLRFKKAEEGYVKDFGECKFRYYLRIKTEDVAGVKEAVKLTFGSFEVLPFSPEGYAEVITGEIAESEAREIFESIERIESIIRIK